MIKKTYTQTQQPSLRIIPLSGLEEVGKNCTILEYGQDIILIDLGLMFPNEEMPGIDYVVPDISYLKKNRNKIRGIILTHGHLDHIGAIPYLIRDLKFPPIFGTRLTMAFLQDRLAEFHLDKKVPLNVIDTAQTIRLGAFQFSLFHINHNIPDATGVGVLTPLGWVVHSGDFKFDYTPEDQKPTEFHKIAKMGGEGVLALIADSTNSEKAGFAISERKIGENLYHLFEEARGRIIISTFATLVSRHQQIINAAVKTNRKIAVSGRSLEQSLDIALNLGYLKLPKSSFVKLKDISKYPDNKLVVMCTGSQGQGSSALSRVSRGEHKNLQIKPGDLVILSSSPIPGNERAVQNLMNSLFRLGAKVIYNKIFDVHVSGHAYQEELKLNLSLLRPKYFIPNHGERHMLERHADLAREIGVPDKNIFILSNGQVLEIKPAPPVGPVDNFTYYKKSVRAYVSSKKIPSHYVMVDGLGVGDIGNVVLRDRQVMSQDGMFVIIITIDNKDLKLIGSPDIISRGFIYMRESKILLKQVRDKVRDIVARHTQTKNVENWQPLKTALRDEIGGFLFQKTERRPMILPVVIEV